MFERGCRILSQMQLTVLCIPEVDLRDVRAIELLIYRAVGFRRTTVKHASADHQSSSNISRILQVPAYLCHIYSPFSCQPGSVVTMTVATGSPFMVGPTPPASDATDTELTMVMRVFLGFGAIAAQVTCKHKPVMFAL
jgi:hypothetical protein